MSDRETVLYDLPGPRARRQTLLVSIVAGVVLAALAAVVLVRLADQGQFSMELWGPIIDPGNQYFDQVWALLGTGVRATLTAAALAIALSLVIGTVIGVGRIMLGRWGRIPLVGLIELFRGLPVVITIFFAWRVLPQLGVDVGPLPGDDGLWYLVIGLTAYNSVIIAEIVRAGVVSLPRGQREAALAVGMTPGQAMRLILLPQAFRAMLPALISQLVVILKDTSLAAVLGLYTELLRVSNRIAQQLDNPIQMFLLAGTMFILVNYGLSELAEYTERRLGRARRSAAEEADRAGTAAVGA